MNIKLIMFIITIMCFLSSFSQVDFDKLEFRDYDLVYIKSDSIPFTGKCKGIINFLSTNYNFIKDMYSSLFKYRNLLVIGQYKYGKANGTWLYYRVDKDTVLYGKERFVRGKLNGKMKFYYPNGNLSEKGSYHNGKLDGRYISKDSNGNLLLRTKYKKGKFNGRFIQKDSNGKILTKLIFKNGDVIKTYKLTTGYKIGP